MGFRHFSGINDLLSTFAGCFGETACWAMAWRLSVSVPGDRVLPSLQLDFIGLFTGVSAR